MPRVDISQPPQTLLRTSFIYGASGAGKTDFCATYPKVAWFGSAREGGAETIRWMDRSRWYEPNVAPMIFVVSNIGELMQHLTNDVMPLVFKGVVKTIALELSFYTDDVIRASGDDVNGWEKYGALEKHVINRDEAWKKIPGLRIVYNALADVQQDDKKPSGPLMAGRALSRKVPAMCDMIGYLATEEVGGQTDRLLHLAPYSNYPARHRYGNKLPAKVRNPTYRQLEALLNGKASCDDRGVVTMHAPATMGALPSLPSLK